MNNYSYKIHYLYEALTLLKILSQPYPYTQNSMAKRAAEYGIVPGPSEEKFVEILEHIEEEARKEFSDDIDDIKNYFVKQGDNIYSYAAILLLHNSVSTDLQDLPDNISIKEYQKCLENVSEEQYNKSFYHLVRSIGSDATENDSKANVDISDIFDAIMEAELEDSNKLKLQQLYFHRKEHIETIFRMLTRAAKVIKRHEKELEAFGSITISYLQNEVKDSDYMDFIMNKLAIKDCGLYSPRKEYNISITYLDCTKVCLTIMGNSLETARFISQIGAIFSENLTLDKVFANFGNKETITQDKALALLKLLSDKSKLEILGLTRNESFYGAQLANKLGLTTATISHHTSALFEQNLLNIEKMDSKIYYKENQDKIRSLIKYLEDTLL